MVSADAVFGKSSDYCEKCSVSFCSGNGFRFVDGKMRKLVGRERVLFL